MLTRKQYMAGECTHREYYGQFVTDEIKQAVLRMFSKKELVQAFKGDEHFNNLPLRQWDNILDPRSYNLGLAKALKEAGNIGGISLSDCVCTCKEAARQIVEESE